MQFFALCLSLSPSLPSVALEICISHRRFLAAEHLSCRRCVGNDASANTSTNERGRERKRGKKEHFNELRIIVERDKPVPQTWSICQKPTAKDSLNHLIYYEIFLLNYCPFREDNGKGKTAKKHDLDFGPHKPTSCARTHRPQREKTCKTTMIVNVDKLPQKLHANL